MPSPLNDPDSNSGIPNTIKDFRPAMTARSVVASLMGLVLMALAIQWSTVWLGMNSSAGEYGLPLPGVSYFLMLLGAGALLAICCGRRLLTRAELLCVFYVLMLAAPLMTQGFWHRVLTITATIPRTGDFAKLQFLSDRLWPHGPNLLAAVGDEVLVLDAGGGETGREFVLPVTAKSGSGLVPGEPYLLTLETRVASLNADAFYYVWLLRPDGSSQEVFRSRQTVGRGGAVREGFFPQGLYGVTFGGLKEGESAVLKIGLQGGGRLEVRRPRLVNVSALEFAYSGLEQVPAEIYDALPAEGRAGLLRRPESLWSAQGLGFLLAGGIPLADWATPLAAWGSFIGMLLLGALAINVIMRRQWVDGEKYPLPLARIPAALIGEPGDSGASGAVWRNRGLWAGAILGLAWGLLKGLHFYNPAIPDTAIRIDLSPYFGPAWGGFWNGVFFEVVAIFVAVAVFVELNVLMSLIVGFLAFRALTWLGTLTGLNALPGYPFGPQQQAASFFVYGLLVLILAHKHVGQTLKEALRPSLTPVEKREVMSYRTAYLLLATVLVGSLAWASWIGVSLSGMLILIIFLLLVALVAAKFRAEAGVPYGNFTPANVALVLMLLGGVPFFGAEVVLLTFLASFIFSMAVFFLIPGAQLEMLELGRHYRVRPRDLLGMMALGIGGGLLVGGWVFLGHAYSQGGEATAYTWAFGSKVWYFSDFNAALTAASPGAAATGGGWNPSHWAYVFGGVVTATLAILRQMFAGFWMHPIGFVLGPSILSQMIWGSLLVAWLLRFLFVRLGGGLAVRTKLQPFFIGVFLGACGSWLLWFAVGTILDARGVDLIYGGLP
jgi:hypothetical protein